MPRKKPLQPIRLSRVGEMLNEYHEYPNRRQGAKIIGLTSATWQRILSDDPDEKFSDKTFRIVATHLQTLDPPLKYEGLKIPIPDQWEVLKELDRIARSSGERTSEDILEEIQRLQKKQDKLLKLLAQIESR
jgi:hypothetical protein